MNQEKIGKFIAECRKNKKMTQAELAEKLNITDRAISKWETGKGMPDTSIMLDLCNELGITVNELLSGEVIEMNNYEKKTEELLLEMAKREEEQNKRLLLAMYIILITSAIFYFITVFLTCYFIPEEPKQLPVIIISTIIFLIAAFIALKFEVDAGYYECRKCHHKFVGEYKDVFWAMHFGTTRYLKCPNCNKRSWSKKVMSK